MRHERYIIMDGDKKLSGWDQLGWAGDALYFYISNGITTARIVPIH